MKAMNWFLMAGLFGSVAQAGPVFQDNKGYLYCEMVCRVDDSVQKEGVFVKNSAGEFSRVRGKWEKVGYTGLMGATYHVNPTVFKAITQKCQEKREQLLNLPSIRGLLEDASFSGISERACRTFPRISISGARTYEVKVDSEDDNTEL